jgi:cysteine desulfurase
VGLAKALELAYASMQNDIREITALKEYMASQLKLSIPGIAFNGDISSEGSLYTVLNVSFPPNDNAEMLLFNLDLAGIACSAGSACSSGSNTGSHVLRAIGTDMSRPSIRFSFSRFNTREEIDYCVEKVKEIFAVNA